MTAAKEVFARGFDASWRGFSSFLSFVPIE
jgi:hypothetical protein